LLTDEALVHEGAQETLDLESYRLRLAGEHVHGRSPDLEQLGCEEVAGLDKKEFRAPEIVEQEPELLSSHPAIWVENVLGHSINSADPVDGEFFDADVFEDLGLVGIRLGGIDVLQGLFQGLDRLQRAAPFEVYSYSSCQTLRLDLKRQGASRVQASDLAIAERRAFKQSKGQMWWNLPPWSEG
jgi:hypothetical protein